MTAGCLILGQLLEEARVGVSIVWSPVRLNKNETPLKAVGSALTEEGHSSFNQQWERGETAKQSQEMRGKRKTGSSKQ